MPCLYNVHPEKSSPAQFLSCRLLCCLILLPVFLAAPGCTATIKKDPVMNQNKKYTAGTILSGKTGAPTTYLEMLEDMNQAQVIFIGEEHTHPSHHHIQHQMIMDIISRYPDTTVGIEMVDQTYQPILNSWVKGELTEQELLEKIHWYANWRYPFDLYRDIFNAARENHISLFGLNIPFHIPPKISVGGLNSLQPEDARHLPRTITLTDTEHRAFVESIFNFHHIQGRENFEYFYQAQCVWEDAMSEAVASHLNQQKMIVIAGNGHILKKFGMPNRMFSRTGASFRTLYLASAGNPVELTYADYIWIAEDSTPE